MNGNHAHFSVMIISFLLISGFLILCISEHSNAEGSEIYVDDSFSLIRDGTAEHPYATITEALNLASEGDTIYVFSGMYNETLLINKRISLIGGIDDGQSILTRGIEHKYLIDISADFVTIENFVLRDSGHYITSQYGALVHITSNNVVIQKNNISQCNLWGIYLDSSNDNTISGNIINDTKGIFVSSSNNNVFSSNNISNSDDAGINMRSSRRNILYQNMFMMNNYGIYSKECSYTNITENTFRKNIFHGLYTIDNGNDIISGNNFKNNSLSGLTLSSYDCIIYGNIFNGGQVGLNLQKTGCHISNNSFENFSSTALSTVQGSSNNIISMNRFFHNNVHAREQGNNEWDDGMNGNTWDTYNYIDKNLDGIGDLPYAIATGGQDHFPLGIFLLPPQKPSNPSPTDDKENVGLSVTLWVKVLDPDSSIISEVSFYNAVTNEKIGTVRNVANGKNASCSLKLPFDTTYAWYAVANDSLQENQSDIWFFITKQRPPENEKPVPNPGGPYVTKLNQSIAFDGSQSIDPDGEIIFYRWNFGDGSSQILDMTPIHTYTDPGTYIVTLTVVDDDGRSSIANTTATIQGVIFVNDPPVATCTTPSAITMNQEVSFDASLSNDSDGSIIGYRWDFNSDGTFDTDWTESPVITYTFSNSGTFVVTLEVKDDKDAVSPYTTTIFVKEASGSTPGFGFLLALLAVLIGLFLFKKQKYRNKF
ncbi:MAG: right-handed parallel beta-helix repeat-containing protein [Candidatus Thermoplasmatota archaeon]|nr:right-handed parallel beta-helix repeat-containing protein [Candidatus Thermoplasmatota archaeon]